MYSGPFLRGIVAQRMRGLGYSGEYDASLYDSNPYTPTLGPPEGGGFTIPTGPLIDQSTIQNSPFANPITVASAGSSPNYGQIAQALTPITAAAYAGQVPRPSPVVQVPLSASTVGLWASNNMSLILAGVAAVVVLGFVGGGRRRR